MWPRPKKEKSEKIERRVARERERVSGLWFAFQSLESARDGEREREREHKRGRKEAERTMGRVTKRRGTTTQGQSVIHSHSCATFINVVVVVSKINTDDSPVLLLE